MPESRFKDGRRVTCLVLKRLSLNSPGTTRAVKLILSTPANRNRVFRQTDGINVFNYVLVTLKYFWSIHFLEYCIIQTLIVLCIIE